MVKNNNTYIFFKYTSNYTAELKNMYPEYTEKIGENAFYMPEDKFHVMKPNDSVNFKGNIYVLVNELSLSAATDFPALMYKYKRGVIVGRETGSAYYQINAIDFPYVNLKNTGLELYMPLVKCTFEKKGESDIPWGRGVLPEYTLEFEYDEFLNENNKGLEFTLKVIESIKKQKLNRLFHTFGAISLLIIGSIVGVLIFIRKRKKNRLAALL